MTSLLVAVCVSILSTFIGFCTAYTDFRYNFFGKQAYLALAMLPPTIPLIIMALAMLSWLAQIGLSGQVISIVISHTVLGAPFAMAVIRLRLNDMDPNLEAASWNLGASEWRTMPLSALDAHLVIRMQSVLTKLQKELGITFVYVTHSQSEAFAMADRVIIMAQGEIAQIGKAKDIYRAPANKFVAEFVGRNNIFEGKVKTRRGDSVIVETMLGDFTVPASAAPNAQTGQPLSFVVAADLVQLSTMRPTGENVVECQLISEQFMGTTVTLFLEAANGSEIKVQIGQRELETLDLAHGGKVYASWPAPRAHVLD